MAKGFFDIVDQYNKSGYGAFQNQGYTPEELAQMYAGQRNSGYLPTMHERAGFGLGSALANLGGAIYKATSPKAKAARAETARQDRVGKVALEEIKTRAQQIAQEQGLDPRAAMEAAAVEAFGTQYQRAGKYDVANRDTAMRVFQEAQNLKGEQGKAPAPTKRVLFLGPNGEEAWVDLKNELPPKGYRQVDESVQNQTRADPSNPEYEFVMERDKFTGNWVPSLDENGVPIRRRRGGVSVTVNNKDPLTEAQRGAMFADAQLAIEGYANAQDIMAMLFNEADQLDWAPGNIVGGLSVAADKISGIGEFLNNVVGTSDPEEAIYQIIGPGGARPATYKELISPANPKYFKAMEAFKKAAQAGQISQQLHASMIELAYMIAVAEEPSARGISDNDIERRLQTLGAAAGSKQTFMNILESARKRLKIKFKNRVDLNPIYNEKDAEGVTLRDKAYSVMGRYGDPNEIDPATPDAVRPDRKRPDVRPAIIPGVNQ